MLPKHTFIVLISKKYTFTKNFTAVGAVSLGEKLGLQTRTRFFGGLVISTLISRQAEFKEPVLG